MWQNPYPNQAFAGQEIELANSYYDWLVMLFAYNNTMYDRIVQTIMFKTGCYASMVVTSQAGARMVERNVYRTSGSNPYKLTVLDCTVQVVGSSPTTENGRLIPYMVYGITTRII